MLNHVERGRIFEQPAGEDLAPGQLAFGVGAFLDKNLNEGPGFSRAFPRQGSLTAGQANHHVPDPARFARFQNDILGDVIAFVQ